MRVSARVGEVRGQMSDLQLRGLASLVDQADVWRCRTMYATLRPTGWRSDPTRCLPSRSLSLVPCIVLLPFSNASIIGDESLRATTLVAERPESHA